MRRLERLSAADILQTFALRLARAILELKACGSEKLLAEGYFFDFPLPREGWGKYFQLSAELILDLNPPRL